MSHVKKIQKSLEGKADALILTSAVNQRYTSGFDYTDGYIFVTPERTYLLADFRYIEAARNEADKNIEVIMPKIAMLEQIKNLAIEHGAKTVMFEDGTLSCAALERIKARFEGTGIELIKGGTALVDTLREFKDSYEIEAIAKAQNIADKAFEHILGFISPDVTEIDVALELEFFMRKNGAEGTSFQTIAVSGSASSLPHGVPRNQKLEKGFFTMDFGAKYNGYCSDMTRTVVIGKADESMKHLYNTVLDAQLAALAAIKEGASRREMDKIARDIIDNAGYKGRFGHSLGHGVGMYIHEAPGLSQGAPEGALLKKGHIVTVEPGIYIEGKYGCRIEDMVAITDSGVINFAHSPKELIEI